MPRCFFDATNLNQYRGADGVFNNRNLSTRKSYGPLSSRLLQ